MAGIDVQPPVLDLSFYAGDGFEFTLNCTDVNGDPIDIVGIFSAHIKLNRTVDEIVTSFAINDDGASQGALILFLTGEQTQELIPLGKSKFSGVWDLQWMPDDSYPRTIVQGSVGCTVDVTR
jgi:hypothetical protein